MAAFASKEAMETTLERNFELMKTDAAFREGTKKSHLSIGFEIDDLYVTFVLAFDHGNVTSTMPADPEEADVQLAMSSDAYDRMFTGELNPMKAALSGELAFAGDIPSAMSLQGLLPEMIRIYKLAKQGQAA